MCIVCIRFVLVGILIGTGARRGKLRKTLDTFVFIPRVNCENGIAAATEESNRHCWFPTTKNVFSHGSIKMSNFRLSCFREHERYHEYILLTKASLSMQFTCIIVITVS